MKCCCAPRPVAVRLVLLQQRKIGIETRTLVGNYPAIKTQSLNVSLAMCSLHHAAKGSVLEVAGKLTRKISS